MSVEEETLDSTFHRDGEPASDPGDLQLVVAWNVAEPGRLGEVGRLGSRATLGRGDDGEERVRWYRERPSGLHPCPPLADPRLSREQLHIRRVDGSWLEIRQVGRRSVFVDDQPLGEGETRRVSAGSRVNIGDRLLLFRRADHPDPRIGGAPPAVR